MFKKVVWISFQSGLISSFGFVLSYIADALIPCEYSVFYLTGKICFTEDLFLTFWIINILSFFVASLYAAYSFDKAKINSGAIIATLAPLSTLVLRLSGSISQFDDISLFIVSIFNFMFFILYATIFHGLRKR